MDDMTLEEKVMLYRTTPEGQMVWDILLKLDNVFSPWASPDIILKTKKELLVQLIEKQPEPLEDNVAYLDATMAQ